MGTPPSTAATSKCPDEDALAACVEGTLDAERARALEVHIEGCGSCYQVLTTYARAYGPQSKQAEKNRDPHDDGESLRSVSNGAFVERLQRTSALAEGTVVGRYVVAQWIGEGGAGVVYAAHDPELDRRIALKLMQPKPEAAEPELVRKRLLREARAMAKLTHPNVVGVYDVGTFGDQVFIAMEFVDGSTLRKWLHDTVPSQPEVLAAFLEAGRGLAAAHAAGLVHRDFKPENVLLAKDGRAKVGDFGLAYPMDIATTDAPSSTSMAEQRSRTVSSIAGTPAYMAPEQKLGAATDARSDQFGFSVALYEALCGTHPFGRETNEPRGTDRLHPLPPRREISARIHRILERGLRFSPEERHPSMDRLLSDLASVGSPRWRRSVQVAAFVALVAGIGIVSIRKADPPPLPASSPAKAAVLSPATEATPLSLDAPPTLTTTEQPPSEDTAKAHEPTEARPRARASSPVAPRRPVAASASQVDLGSYQ